MKIGKTFKKAMKASWDTYCDANAIYAESIMLRYVQPEGKEKSNK